MTSMKILVCSDSHGRVSNLCRLAEREQPDLVFHLGDTVRDGYNLHLACPDLPIEQVAGNCDYAGQAPLEKTLLLEGCRFVLCHGHMYSVKQGYRCLAQRGREAQADMILCGHTHRPWHDTYGSLQVCNPGTVGMGPDPTYGILTVERGMATFTIKHVF